MNFNNDNYGNIVSRELRNIVTLSYNSTTKRFYGSFPGTLRYSFSQQITVIHRYTYSSDNSAVNVNITF